MLYFKQEDMVSTIEEYTTLLQIETPNPNKVFWKKTKGVGFIKKMLQITGLDMMDDHWLNEKHQKRKASAFRGNF